MPLSIYFTFAFLLPTLISQLPQSTLGKTHLQVIAIRGADYKKMFDRGYPVLEYKRTIANDSAFGNYSITELIYFEHDTCIKDVTILPADQADSYVNAFNHKFQPAGFRSWMEPDSSVITISVIDNLLDITSFSNTYYKKISAH